LRYHLQNDINYMRIVLNTVLIRFFIHGWSQTDQILLVK